MSVVLITELGDGQNILARAASGPGAHVPGSVLKNVHPKSADPGNRHKSLFADALKAVFFRKSDPNLVRPAVGHAGAPVQTNEARALAAF